MIKLYPSPVYRRVIALGLDFLFMVMMIYAFGIAILPMALATDSEYLAEALCFIFGLVVLFYIPVAESLFHGKTIGKAAMGIRTVRTEATAVSMVNALQRYLLLPFDIFLTVGIGGIVSILVTRRRQRLGDLFGGTMVVSDKPYLKTWRNLSLVDYHTLQAAERRLADRIPEHQRNLASSDPLTRARLYNEVECDIAMLNTHNTAPAMTEYLDSVLSALHLSVFRRRAYTPRDMIRVTLHNIPRAVYESRRHIIFSLVIALAAYAIGVYSQVTDAAFFREIVGDNYTDMSLDNIKDNNPMGVYQSMDPLLMFFRIFMNNMLVTLRLYVMGIVVLFGPLVMLVNNFVLIGAFDAFFAQHGYLADALISPNEHGVLELSSIVIAGGAALRLGTGWLFPGSLTRLEALKRGARQSMLVLISTLPVLFVAAFIESFITRYSSWPMPVKLSIILVSSVFIIGYYVMLPIRTKRDRCGA